MNSGFMKDEYLDASANMRHYGNMRFALLTLFSALMAGLFSILFKGEPATIEASRNAIKIAGVLIPVVFWIMEERATKYFDHYRERAESLEEKMGFKQHTERPERGILGMNIFTAANATRSLYVAAVIFWISS